GESIVVLAERVERIEAEDGHRHLLAVYGGGDLTAQRVLDRPWVRSLRLLLRARGGHGGRQDEKGGFDVFHFAYPKKMTGFSGRFGHDANGVDVGFHHATERCVHHAMSLQRL